MQFTRKLNKLGKGYLVLLVIIVLLVSLLDSCDKLSESIVDANNESDVIDENKDDRMLEMEFSTTVYKTQILPKIGHEAVLFKDYFWIMGGSEPNVQGYKNDLWKSSDGITWEKVLEHTAWDTRRYFNLFVYQNKLWIIGGKSDRDANGNKYTAPNDDALNRLGWKGDVWNSEDGENWTKLIEYGPWQTRHGSAVAVFNNKLFFIGGHSTINWHVYQDIYESSNGIDWTRVGEISDNTIGVAESREGIWEHDIIEFKGTLFLFGGERASAYNVFNWVLESLDGRNWKTTTKEPTWKDNDSAFDMRFLRPFIFKDRLWVIVERELFFSEDGASWEKQMDLPLFNGNHLRNPRTIVKDNSIYIYGSYVILLGTKDTQINLIKLDLKTN